MTQPRLGFQPRPEDATAPALLPKADWPDLTNIAEVELDCETNGVSWVKGDRPIGWALGLPDDTDRYFGFGHKGGGNNCTREEWRSYARRELRGKRIRNHSTKFDVHMSRVDGVDLVDQGCTFHDVAHSAALLDDHRRDYSLDALAKTYLTEAKIDIGPKDDLEDLPAGIVGRYACQDTRLVRRLVDRFAPLLTDEGLHTVSALEDSVLPVVVEMERNGMPLDMDLLTLWEGYSKRILEKMQWELYRQAGFAVNVDSAKDLQRLFNQCKEGPGWTPGGAPSFTAPIMLDAGSRHPAILLAYRIGKVVDLRNKYLVKYLHDAHEGVLYPNLWQLLYDEGGTVSGRFSCTKPNMQQVMGADKHKRAYAWLAELAQQYLGVHADFLIKRLFRARPGHVWFSADAKQIEYRLFAHYAQAKAIMDRYAADPETDFHNIVQHDLLEKYRPDITRTETKVSNFLKIFGGRSKALARNLNIGYDEAAELNDAYDRAFPEAKELGDRAMRRAEQRGFVVSILGRRSRFPLVKQHGKGGNTWWKRDRTHKALNAVIQSSAADINKRKLREVYDVRKEFGLTMRMTVHDSSENELADAALLGRLRDVFNEQTTPVSVPILWDCNVGETWATAK